MDRTSSASALKSRLTAIGAAALLALVACAPSRSATEPASSTSPLAPTATTHRATNLQTTRATKTASPQDHVVVAVRSFWSLYLQLGARTGRFNPSETLARLAQRSSGNELTKLFNVFQGNAAAGLVVKGTIDVAPKVISIVGTTALVHDCYDDRTGLYRVSDGRRIDTADPRRHEVLMTLKREGAVWKVSAIKDEGLGCTV